MKYLTKNLCDKYSLQCIYVKLAVSVVGCLFQYPPKQSLTLKLQYLKSPENLSKIWYKKHQQKYLRLQLRKLHFLHIVTSLHYSTTITNNRIICHMAKCNG